MKTRRQSIAELVSSSNTVLAPETPDGTIYGPRSLLLSDSVVAAALASGVVTIMETPESSDTNANKTKAILKTNGAESCVGRRSIARTARMRNANAELEGITQTGTFPHKATKEQNHREADEISKESINSAIVNGVSSSDEEDNLFRSKSLRNKNTNIRNCFENMKATSPVYADVNPTNSASRRYHKLNNNRKRPPLHSSSEEEVGGEKKTVKQNNCAGSGNAIGFCFEGGNVAGRLLEASDGDMSDGEFAAFRGRKRRNIMSIFEDSIAEPLPQSPSKSPGHSKRNKRQYLAEVTKNASPCKGISANIRRKSVAVLDLNSELVKSRKLNKNLLDKRKSAFGSLPSLVSPRQSLVSPRPSYRTDKLNFLNAGVNAAELMDFKITAFEAQKQSRAMASSSPSMQGLLNQVASDKASEMMKVSSDGVSGKCLSVLHNSVNTGAATDNTTLSLTDLLGTPTKRLNFSTSSDAPSPKSGAAGNEEQFEDTLPTKALLLAGVTAFVDVRSSDGSNRSEVVSDRLRALGATVTQRMGQGVTHVFFRDGLKSTFQQSVKRGLPLLSSTWLEQSEKAGYMLPEDQFPSVSYEKYSNPLFLAKLRKGRSMQPKDFKEQEEAAEARLRRRLRLAAARAAAAAGGSTGSRILQPPVAVAGDAGTSSSPVATDTDKEDDWMAKDVNSPLYGIAHLLTPKRRTPTTSDDEEDDTPDLLAASPHLLPPAPTILKPTHQTTQHHLAGGRSTVVMDSLVSTERADPTTSNLLHPPTGDRNRFFDNILELSEQRRRMLMCSGAGGGEDDVRHQLRNKFLARVQKNLLAKKEATSAQSRTTNSSSDGCGGGLDTQPIDCPTFGAASLIVPDGNNLNSVDCFMNGEFVPSVNKLKALDDLHEPSHSVLASPNSSRVYKGKLLSNFNACSGDYTTQRNSLQSSQILASLNVTPRRPTRRSCKLFEATHDTTTTAAAVVDTLDAKVLDCREETDINNCKIATADLATARETILDMNATVSRLQLLSSGDDDDYNTPLATRMYYKFLARRQEPASDDSSKEVSSEACNAAVGADDDTVLLNPAESSVAGGGGVVGGGTGTGKRKSLCTASRDRKQGKSGGEASPTHTRNSILESTRNLNESQPAGTGGYKSIVEEINPDVSSIKSSPVPGIRDGLLESVKRRRSSRISSCFGRLNVPSHVHVVAATGGGHDTDACVIVDVAAKDISDDTVDIVTVAANNNADAVDIVAIANNDDVSSNSSDIVDVAVNDVSDVNQLLLQQSVGASSLNESSLYGGKRRVCSSLAGVEQTQNYASGALLQTTQLRNKVASPVRLSPGKAGVSSSIVASKDLNKTESEAAAVEAAAVVKKPKRRRFLHNEQLDCIEQELIVPLTPPIEDHHTAAAVSDAVTRIKGMAKIYDELRISGSMKKGTKAQRRSITAKHIKLQEPMPLPRLSKQTNVNPCITDTGVSNKTTAINSSDGRKQRLESVPETEEEDDALEKNAPSTSKSRGTVPKKSPAASDTRKKVRKSDDDSYSVFVESNAGGSNTKKRRKTKQIFDLTTNVKGTPRTVSSSRKTVSRSRSRGSGKSTSAEEGSNGVAAAGISITGSGVSKKRTRKNSKSLLVSDTLPSICLTSVHSSETEVLYPIISSLGGFNIKTRVAACTTHLVTGVHSSTYSTSKAPIPSSNNKEEEDDVSSTPAATIRRTVNLLLGCLRGCRLLTVDWVYDSLEQQSWRWGEELQPYSDPVCRFCPAAVVVQGLLSSGKTVRLLSALGAFFVHPDTAPPPLDCLELLELAGASVVQHMTAAQIIIWPQSSHTTPAALQQLLPLLQHNRTISHRNSRRRTTVNALLPNRNQYHSGNKRTTVNASSNRSRKSSAKLSIGGEEESGVCSKNNGCNDDGSCDTLMQNYNGSTGLCGGFEGTNRPMLDGNILQSIIASSKLSTENNDEEEDNVDDTVILLPDARDADSVYDTPVAAAGSSSEANAYSYHSGVSPLVSNGCSSSSRAAILTCQRKAPFHISAGIINNINNNNTASKPSRSNSSMSVDYPCTNGRKQFSSRPSYKTSTQNRPKGLDTCVNSDGNCGIVGSVSVLKSVPECRGDDADRDNESDKDEELEDCITAWRAVHGTGAIVVHEKWLLDSIQFYVIKPFHNYTVKEVEEARAKIIDNSCS